MGRTISIGILNRSELIKGELCRSLEQWKAEGVKIDYAEKKMGETAVFACNLTRASNGARSMAMLNRLATILTDIIISRWEQPLLTKFLKVDLPHFDQDERDRILERTLTLLGEVDQKAGSSRREIITRPIRDYLRTNDQFIFEGFINFRLKDYIEHLDHIMELAIEEHLMDKEYHEFIVLLKHFVKNQDPRIFEVHVVIGSRGIFRLLDAQGKSINSDYLEGVIVDLVDNELNYDDLLISALISIAPVRIVLHFNRVEQNGEVVETIKKVFGDRVTVCEGCQQCSN